MCISYGYCRISRKTQSLSRQERNIIAEYPGVKIIREIWTGTKLDRPEWNKLFKMVKAGDRIIFDSVSRMSRNAEEGIKAYFELYDRGVSLIFIKEHYIDTEIYKNNLNDKIPLIGSDEDEILKGINNYFRKLAEKQIRIAFEQAEKEVLDLHQRTKEGILTAKMNGKQIGQKKGNILTVKKKAPAKKLILKHSRSFGGSLNDAECMSLAKVSKNTYYKYKKEVYEEIANKKHLSTQN